MARRQQALAAKILQDKDVQSLSSYIGVDAQNTTGNVGRFIPNNGGKDFFGNPLPTTDPCIGLNEIATK